jgi:hypothetical protein
MANLFKAAHIEDTTQDDCGCRKLLIALIERSLLDLRGKVGAASGYTNPANDALGWFLRRDRKPFSFLWACTELDLEPESVRSIAWGLYEKSRAVNRFNVNRRGGPPRRRLNESA